MFHHCVCFFASFYWGKNAWKNKHKEEIRTRLLIMNNDNNNKEVSLSLSISRSRAHNTQPLLSSTCRSRSSRLPSKSEPREASSRRLRGVPLIPHRRTNAFRVLEEDGVQSTDRSRLLWLSVWREASNDTTRDDEEFSAAPKRVATQRETTKNRNASRKKKRRKPLERH